MNAVALAQALIACPSVTPHEAGALRLLEGVLADSGFRVAPMVFTQPGAADVHNLYARIGDDAPCLMFAGHTDVVPPGDAAAWRFDPFAGEAAEGFIWGRGAVDMKGAIAAFTAAALAFLAQHGPPRGSIAFLLTGDEEGPAVNGSVKLLDWAHEHGERFDHCIVGEPTNAAALGDTIKIGRRGSLSGMVTVKGRQGHVAYPERADNPIPLLLRAVAALSEPLDAGTEHFSASNLEFTCIDVGDGAVNVIPATARAAFNVRFNDLWTAQSLAAALAARLTDARATIDFAPSNAPAFLTEPDAFTQLVAGVIERVTGRRPALTTTGGTSDARFIKAYGPVLEFGLVGATMHARDERAPVADIDQLTAIYRGVLEDYFR